MEGGTELGVQPGTRVPDWDSAGGCAGLGDDDRTGLRVLYPDPADTVHRGSIRGRIVGAAIGGWSCAAPGPAQFDGGYEIDGLTVGHSYAVYAVYAEPLNGAVDPSQIGNAIVPLCRNATTDAGWPPLQGCVVPTVDTSVTTRTRPGP